MIDDLFIAAGSCTDHIRILTRKERHSSSGVVLRA
jgi:hypothetical protein